MAATKGGPCLRVRRQCPALLMAATAAPTKPPRPLPPPPLLAFTRAAYTWVVAAGWHASVAHAGSVAAQGQLFALSRRIAWPLAFYVASQSAFPQGLERGYREKLGRHECSCHVLMEPLRVGWLLHVTLAFTG